MLSENVGFACGKMLGGDRSNATLPRKGELSERVFNVVAIFSVHMQLERVPYN